MLINFTSLKNTCATALPERNSQMSCYGPQTDCLGVRKEFFSLDKALHNWQQCSVGCFSASCEPSYMVHCQNQVIKVLNLVWYSNLGELEVMY